MAYNVANTPGVPALLGGFAPQAAVALGAITDISASLPGFGLEQWGIYKDGMPVVVADTVIGFHRRKEYVVADFPIEGVPGSNQAAAFESYDKVERPFDVRVRFAAGSDYPTRMALIQSVEAIEGDTQVYDFVSPEAVYESVTIAHCDYDRNRLQGAGVLVLDVWGWQIMVETESGVTSAQNPGGNDAKTSTVTPQDVQGPYADTIISNWNNGVLNQGVQGANAYTAFGSPGAGGLGLYQPYQGP